MEKSRSWPSAHDWKSCIPQKGIEGSNPSFSAIKQEPILMDGFLFYEEGGFEPLNATVRWTVACRRLDDGNSLIFIPIGNENVNKSLLLPPSVLTI